MPERIAVYGDGFIKYDTDESITFEMLYDADGQYRGQNQDNMIEAGTIFLSAQMINGLPCVNGRPVAPLTEEQMAAATAEDNEVMARFRR